MLLIFYSLAADIGGNWALFLGASLLSVTELSEFLISILVFVWWKMSKTSSPADVTKEDPAAVTQESST